MIKGSEPHRMCLAGDLNGRTVTGLDMIGRDWISRYDHLTVDCSEISSVNTAAAALLAGWYRYAQSVSCDLSYVGITEQLRAILTVSGVFDLLPIKDEDTPETKRENMQAQQLQTLLSAQLEGADVQVWSDDDVHFNALVVSAHFSGCSRLARQQQVNAIVAPYIESGEVHALSLKTLTPEEYAQQSGAAHG